jgi:predicted Zn-dependent peptidase
MRYHSVIILFVLSFLFNIYSAKAQFGSTSGGPLTIKLMNGMNGVMYPTSDISKTEITLYFKSGSIYENDSFAGINNVIRSIIADRIQSGIARNAQGLNSANAVFVSYCEPEHTVFRFTVNEANMGSVFRVLRDSVFLAKFSQPEIDTALARVQYQIETDGTVPSHIFSNRILKEVFRQDYQKLMPLGNPEKFKYIHLASVAKYFDKYYVASNAILSATGKFTVSAFDTNFNLAFSPLAPSEFDPETITKIIDFRPMIYSNQFVVNDTVQNPEFRIYWQFPGTYSYQQGSYFAYLFTEMFNDRNNYLHVLAQRQGCRKLEAHYEPSSFSGTFSITLQPDKNKLLATYDWLMYEIGRVNNTLVNESMLNAAKLLFKKHHSELKQTKQYVDDLIAFWPYKESNYIVEMPDSVLDINEKEMRHFVGEYMIQNAHVTGLVINSSDRISLQVDSFFTDVTDSVKDYVFTYRPNVTDLEGPDNLAMFSKLAQWLKANPDVNAKVNGYADKSEYNKVYSDTIMKFIDSIPTFRKTMPDLIKKGYLTPEMMRSLKMIKMLNDYGIALERLSGTSMTYSSGSPGNQSDNMKCTLSLRKMRNVISVKEYHYGKSTR